jgi:hypothetical protein
LVERIESELSARTDVDPCARVHLRLDGDGVLTVLVTLPDGRAASRGVTESDDVMPTLQALLLVPVLPAPQRIALSDDRNGGEREMASSTTAEHSLGVELSLLTGARLGAGQLGVGVGALSFLERSGWLIGFEGRADSYRALAGSDPATVLELAILAGRRLDLGSLSLDLAAGPAVALKDFAASSHVEQQHVNATFSALSPSEVPPPEMPAPDRSWERSTGPVPRLLLSARLGFRPRSLFRTFVGIDGELGPALARSDPSSASLPAYSLGFSLGATLGTQ